jgi:hypothetical protein
MELTSSLLVMFMFVIILSLGIANLLSAFAEVVNRRSEVRIHWLHANWMTLLLLFFFSLFWQSLDILAIEEWGFGGFLFINAGAVLIFFAASVIMPAPIQQGEDTQAAYFAMSRQFFFLFALTAAWLVAVDLVYSGGFTAVAINSVGAGLGLLLAFSRTIRIHSIGTLLAWVLTLGELVLQGAGYLG